MNIFVLDKDTKKCAKYHNNKHVVKMILETSQLLCGVHWCSGGEAPYKLSHKNHPCAIWERTSLSNYRWLLSLGKELCEEYTYRYNKTHKCEQILYWLEENEPNIPESGLTEFVLAMPIEYKVDSAVHSYRNYYMGDKREFCVWKDREIPYWYK